MSRIQILDCTLRDGGYINQFSFGKKVICDIIRKLVNASVEIIECGFLKSNAFEEDKSLFGSIEAIKEIIGIKNPKILYVAMIQYGAISNEEISVCDGTSVDGIRVTFHEHEIEPAFVLGKQLMKKGYKVFMQPVGTMTYTDEALLTLIQKVNELQPFAFYIVDTLGSMYKNDLLRMFYLIDHNLNKKIVVGFHSHNNLQLSFANAQDLMRVDTQRKLIIDTSLYGMGRGAGNLCTELITQYINTTIELRYDNLEILEAIDSYIKPLDAQYRWGYDVAYCIAATAKCHPNYASFLLNKQTLHIKDIHAILSTLKTEERALFHKEYIKEQYIKYMSHRVDDKPVVEFLEESVKDKSVLLLAPGKSLNSNIEIIRTEIKKQNYYVVSINFLPKDIPINMLFVSNMKRFGTIEELNLSEKICTVITSNITVNKSDARIVDYSSYLNEEECIVDNAGLMCINLLRKVGVKKVILAGFDGFTMNRKDDFFDEAMYMDVETEHRLKINEAMSRKIKALSKQMEISFLTESVY